MAHRPLELHDQFLVSRERSSAVPARWKQRRLAEWLLLSHPSLPVSDVQGPDGRRLGLLLGWAVAADGGLITPDSQVCCPGTWGQAQFEDWLYTLAGRFAFLGGAEIAGAPRLYLDPCGTLSAVYCPDRQMVASTATLLNWANWSSYAQRKSREPVLRPNQFWPAGLTSDPEIARLLPNHYLDLQSFQAVRHWPRSPVAVLEAEDERLLSVVDRIARLTTRTVQGVAAQRSMYLGLTAGRDSRMLLACARPALERADFVTFSYTDPDRKADPHIARRLARRLDLRHTLLPLVQPTGPQKQQYLLRVGYVGHWGKARDFDVACRRHLRMDRAWLTGFGGEVGRAFYWSASDDSMCWPSAQDLLARLKPPDDPRVADAFSRWLAGMPPCGTFELLDRMYIEQRMGCWAGPHMYGTAPFAASLSPFCQREMMELVMSLPTAFRRRQRLADAIADRMWPELRELPYQELTGLRLLTFRARQSLTGRAKSVALRARRAARKALGIRR